jgi:hypothetical protein
MEFYRKTGFQVHVHELAYDLGYTGYAIVYRQYAEVIRVKQIYFGDDHVFATREEAHAILRSLVRQYIEAEGG